MEVLVVLVPAALAVVKLVLQVNLQDLVETWVGFLDMHLLGAKVHAVIEASRTANLLLDVTVEMLEGAQCIFVPEVSDLDVAEYQPPVAVIAVAEEAVAAGLVEEVAPQVGTVALVEVALASVILGNTT